MVRVTSRPTRFCSVSDDCMTAPLRRRVIKIGAKSVCSGASQINPLHTVCKRLHVLAASVAQHSLIYSNERSN